MIYFPQDRKNKSREKEKDLLQCLGSCFVSKPTNTNSNIDFVRSKLLSSKQNDCSGRNIFYLHQKRKNISLRKKARAFQSLAF